MKLEKLAGATSEIWQVFIRDSSSTTGAGLTGLAFNSSSLTAYYHRDTDTTATAISLVTMTVGTFTSSGFKEIDATNMPGFYQLCPPNAAIAAGAKSCAFMLKGATNMAPLPIEVQLVSYNPDDAVRMGMTALPNAAANAAGGLPVSSAGALDLDEMNVDIEAIQASTAGLTFTVANEVDVNVLKIGGTTQTARDIGASVLLSAGAGAGQLDFTSGVVKSNLVQILATALTETAGLLAGGFKKFFNVASPTLTCLGVDQTGDNYARLGAPAGASVSADIAAIKSDTGTILTDVNTGAGAIYTRIGAPAGASIAADIAAAKTNIDATKTQTDKMTFTVPNVIDANALRINGDATAAADLAKAADTVIRGTCSGGTTTTAVVSALVNPSSLTDSGQLIGRTIIFNGATSTANVQCQASSITGSTTGATPTITFPAMTTAPANGDTFVIV